MLRRVHFTASLGLNPDLLRAAGVCLHVDLFASVRRDDLERGGQIVQSHRLSFSFVLSSFTLASCQGGRRENRLWHIGRLSWVARAPRVGRSCVRSVADRTALYR
jgi:hypothetical protein